MMEKLYVIQYESIARDGSTTSISTQRGIAPLTQKDGVISLYFTEEERGEFIKQYIQLRKSWYCANLRTYKVTAFEELDIDKLLDF